MPIIVQITACEGEVFGLGADNLVYEWDSTSGGWEINISSKHQKDFLRDFGRKYGKPEMYIQEKESKEKLT